ncbi:MAG: TIGR00730 family Rossman fold protein [Sphingomonadaceae bacterium]|nr:TIGR00730 family Rossman fold protein [Sphingomonadaceae bacterium]
MNDATPVRRERPFPPAREDAAAASRHGGPQPSPQTASSAYRLAFQDLDFLLREDLRPVRFQLELLKPELMLAEAGVHSTLVFYGSARIPPPEAAAGIVNATEGPGRAVAERLAAKSRYYAEARELARLASLEGKGEHYVVCSGGGPSIMEAANRGASDVGAPSIGLNIVLPHEQRPNEYITPELSFQFHYFALRKMHFLLRARAVAVFPGGFGTFDEMFELLTLIQTGKMKPIPVLLFGREYWERVVGWDALVEEGVISAWDLKLIEWVETAAEAWSAIRSADV